MTTSVSQPTNFNFLVFLTPQESLLAKAAADSISYELM